MTPARTSLMLSRHGRTVWHEENRYAGTSDIDLDDVGRSQAAQLAVWAGVHVPTAVVCSPVRRARETAAASAATIGMVALVVDDLREVGFGSAEGRTLRELATDDAGMVDRFRRDPVGHHFPGGEPPRAAADRGAAALRRLAAEHAGETVLVVAHNTLLRLALCQVLGIDIRLYRDVFPRLDNGALTRLSLPSQGRGVGSLVSLNVPLPDALPRPAAPRAPRALPAAALPAAALPAGGLPDGASPWLSTR